MSSFRPRGAWRQPRVRLACLQLVCALLACEATATEANQPEQDELKRLSIEQLMQIDVTTPGRRAEPLGTTAAALSVITGDDIRRSGVTTIADALRLADGVHVGRFNNGSWAVTTRGFNQSTANKLLVMVDGRTVYSPLFAGVFWNVLDYVLEDIERIEVIRGPGATLWGANAVNGVVNIITRSARETQGAHLSVATGNEDRAIVEARYGGTAGSVGWRVYGKFADRDSQRLATGASSGDDRQRGQAGFRADGGSVDGSNWRVSGDAFHSRDSLPDRPDGEFTEMNVQGRWSGVVSSASRVTLQSYYRREYRRVPRQLTHHIDVFDADGQHSTQIGDRHGIVWGGGVRVNRDETHGSAALRFDPASRTYPVFNVFAQDEITILDDRLFATAGVKWEHNAFSGGELQPSARARLLLPRNQVAWGALSHAVRRPTRFEDDVVALIGGTPAVVGSDDVEAESLVAAEAGYRIQPSPLVSVEAVVFHHRISDLRSQEAPVTGVFPLVVGNSLEGRSRGVELGFNVQPRPFWRTHVGYTWLDTEIERSPGSRHVEGFAVEANDPHHLINLRSSLDLPRDVEVDAFVRSVGALPRPQVPSFTELTLRVGWLATPSIEIWAAGVDLLHEQHLEFGPAVAFERAVRAGLTIRSR